MLGRKFNVDKSSVDRKRNFGDKDEPGHNYLQVYDFFLKQLVIKTQMNNEIFKMLELGAGPDWNFGASARMFLEYLPDNSEISIAEIRDRAEELNQIGVKSFIGDLGKLEFLNELQLSGPYNLILDDASHKWGHQIEGFMELFDIVSDGGIYIVEDLQTSYGQLREQYKSFNSLAGFKNIDAATFFHFLSLSVLGGSATNLRVPLIKSFVRDDRIIKLSSKIRSITFIHGAAIIVKKDKSGDFLGF